MIGLLSSNNEDSLGEIPEFIDTYDTINQIKNGKILQLSEKTGSFDWFPCSGNIVGEVYHNKEKTFSSIFIQEIGVKNNENEVTYQFTHEENEFGSSSRISVPQGYNTWLEIELINDKVQFIDCLEVRYEKEYDDLSITEIQK